MKNKTISKLKKKKIPLNKGSIFCHVLKKKIISKLEIVIILMNHKKNGGIPNFPKIIIISKNFNSSGDGNKE